MDENAIYTTAAQLREIYGDVDAIEHAGMLAVLQACEGDAAGAEGWLAVANAIAAMCPLDD